MKFGGGSAMYLGGFIFNGTSPPVEIKGTINQNK